MRLGQDTGAALVSMIWLTLLLGLLAVGVMNITLISRQLPETILDRKQNEYLAESAMTVFLQRYFRNDLGEHVTFQAFELLGREVSVSVEVENAKIGLNKADQHLLSATIAANGYEVALAEGIADAIIDWRDQDSIVTGNGAETDTYKADGFTYGVRNGPFETVGELLYVRGVTAEMVRCLSPVLTTYFSTTIDDVELNYSSNAVKDIFRWARQNTWHNQGWVDPDNLPPSFDDLKLATKAITLTAQVVGDDQSRFSKVVRIKTSTAEETTYTTLTPLVKTTTNRSCS